MPRRTKVAPAVLVADSGPTHDTLSGILLAKRSVAVAVSPRISADKEPQASADGSSDASSRLGRWLLWTVTTLVYLLCAVHLAAEAYFYHQIPSTIVAVNMRAFGVSIDMSNYPVLVVMHAMAAGICFALLLEMLLYSIWFKQLMFTHEAFLRKTTTSLRRVTATVSSQQAMWGVGRRSLQCWARWFGHDGVFGVNKSYFPSLFLVRELCEIGLQSYQAFQMSQLVPRVWLNECYVLLVVVSCWSSPVLHVVYGKHHRARLRMCLLIDVLLDVASVVGVPTILAIPYLQAYDPRTQDFKTVYWNSDIWYINMVNEFQMLFIQSWQDCVAHFLFCASLLMCLDDVKILASDSTNRNKAVITAPAPVSMSPPPQPPHRFRELITETKAQRWQRKLSAFCHVIMVVWGFSILALYLEAAQYEDIVGCLVYVRPWGSPKTACSLLLIDCLDGHHAMALGGTASEIEKAWAEINFDALDLLTIANCPTLHIPASIHGFSRLMGLNIVNATVVEWTADAALTRAHHPNLRHLGFLWVDFSPASSSSSGDVFPAGLLAHDFPPLLLDIFILECNLGDLPSDLNEKWPAHTNMLLPSNSFQHIPEVLLAMHPMRISLDDNAIETIPLSVFAIDSLVSLELPGNPLRELPSLAESQTAAPFQLGGSFAHLNIMATNVSELPEWMMTDAFLSRVAVRAGGSPLCAKALGNAGDAPNAFLLARIDCSE